MCGIVCAFDLKENSSSLRPKVLEMSKKVRHRGPDWNGIFEIAFSVKKISLGSNFSIIINILANETHLCHA